MTTVLPPVATRPARDLRPLVPPPTAPADRQPARWRPVLVLALLMAGSAVLSSVLLLHQSLRLDEAQSLWQTGHGFGRMYQLVAQDVHVPLYHTLLHLWVLAFGNGVTAARVLSLGFFLLTIPATYALGRTAFSVRSSLFGATLVALSPFMTWYGSEIRMYSLLALVVVLNQLFFVRIFQRAPGANWTFYALTATVGIYTHYFFWLTLVTQAVFYLLKRRRFAAGTLLRLAGVAGLLVVAISPWLLYVRSEGGSGGNQPLLAAPTSVDLFNTFSQFFFGFQDDRINTLLVATWPLAVLLALLAVQKSQRLPAEVGFFLLMAVFPIGAAFAESTYLRPIYISRYLIVCLPSLMLFLVWMFNAYGRRTGWLLRIAFTALMVATSLHQAVARSTPVKEDYQAATRYLETAAQPQDVVVVSPPFTSYPFDYYWSGSAATTTLPQWNRFVAGSAPAFDKATLPTEVGQIAAGHHDAWLVLSYDQGYQKTVLDYFDAHYERLDSRPISPGLQVVHFRLRYDIPDTAALLHSLNTPAG